MGIAGFKAHLILATNGIHLALGGGGEFIAVPWARNGSLDSIAANLETGLRIASNGLELSTTTIGINVVAIYFLLKLVMLRAETRSSQRVDIALAPAL